MTDEDKMLFRERAANIALQGLIASDKEIDYKLAAYQAYEYADAMLEEFEAYSK